MEFMWERFYICKHSINKVLPLSVCFPARETAIKAVVLFFTYSHTSTPLSACLRFPLAPGTYFPTLLER